MPLDRFGRQAHRPRDALIWQGEHEHSQYIQFPLAQGGALGPRERRGCDFAAAGFGVQQTIYVKVEEGVLPVLLPNLGEDARRFWRCIQERAHQSEPMTES